MLYSYLSTLKLLELCGVLLMGQTHPQSIHQSNAQLILQFAHKFEVYTSLEIALITVNKREMQVAVLLVALLSVCSWTTLSVDGKILSKLLSANHGGEIRYNNN